MVKDNESFGAAESSSRKETAGISENKVPVQAAVAVSESDTETPLTKHIYSLIENKEYGQAIQVLQTLLDSGRRERSVLSVLGYCHFTMQNYEAAAEIYATLSDSICPEVPEYAFYLVQSLYLSN